MDSPDVQQALAALRHRLDGGRRIVLGITGAPGSGKSTFAARLQQEFGPDLAVVEPFSLLKVLFIAGIVGCAAGLKSLRPGNPRTLRLALLRNPPADAEGNQVPEG